MIGVILNITMSVEWLLRKKGTFLILRTLKFKPLYYNSIKAQIIDGISSRTLDFRLKELLRLNLLNCEELEQSGFLRKQYSLTKKGYFILTSLEFMEKIIIDEISNQNVPNEIDRMFKKIDLYDFNFIWSQIKEKLSLNSIIFTLKKKQRNEIIELKNTEVIVKTEKGIDKIPLIDIENAWYNFIEREELYQDDHQLSTYRSSFILSLFSQLEYVRVKSEPKLSIILDINKIPKI